MIPLRFRSRNWLSKERVRLAFQIAGYTGESKAQVAWPPYHERSRLEERYNYVLKELKWRDKNKPGFWSQIFGRRSQQFK